MPRFGMVSCDRVPRLPDVPDLAAVTFDFWNTLLHAPEPTSTRAARSERLLTVFAQLGHDIDPTVLDAVLNEVVDTFNRKWADNEQYTYLEAVEAMLRRLDVEVELDAHERLAGAFTGADSPHLPALAPNVEQVLRALRARGVRIGIICDVGLSPSTVLRRHLDRHGVLELFDHWSFSDEVGWYKPDRRIFEHALTGLGVSSGEVAHVGDLRRTDIAGAKSVGWFAVRYCGIHDDHDPQAAGIEGDAVVSNHLDLLDALGVA